MNNGVLPTSTKERDNISNRITMADIIGMVLSLPLFESIKNIAIGIAVLGLLIDDFCNIIK